MTTREIIQTYLIQGKHVDSTDDEFFTALKIRIGREHLLQVLREKGHLVGVIPQENHERYFKHSSWSDLVTMTDCCLGLKTESFYDTLD